VNVNIEKLTKERTKKLQQGEKSKWNLKDQGLHDCIESGKKRTTKI